MCSRVFITETFDGFLKAIPFLRPSPRSKIRKYGDRSPTDPVLVCSIPSGVDPQWESKECSWGFLLSGQVKKRQAEFINARSETLLEKPTWKGAASVPSTRCIVPISGFYEWPNGVRHRILPKVADGFFIAGLTCLWTLPGESLDTFTVITTEPSWEFKPFHDRMPAILTLEQSHQWLTERDPIEAVKLLRPAKDGTILVAESPTRPVQEKLDLGF